MSASDAPLHRFSFSGKTGEYFRICLVNFLLIFITLGLYMPWAKIRARRYLYGSTSLAGFGNFDYHANPWTILMSRLIIVLVVFGGAYWAGEKALENAVYTAVLFLLLPWAIVRSLAFNARYTSFAGARFSFDKKYAPVYLIFVPCILPALIFPAALLLAGADFAGIESTFRKVIFTLLLFLPPALPWLFRAYHAFRAGNHRLGAGVQFHFEKKGIGDYLKAVWFPFLAALFLLYLPFMLFHIWENEIPDSLGAFIVSSLSAMIWVFAASALLRTFWNRVEFSAGEHRGRFVADFGIAEFAIKIIAINAVAIVLSLGLFYPWAKIRRTRYLAAHIHVLAPAAMLQNLPALAGAGESALGAELDSAEGFDFDIGLI